MILFGFILILGLLGLLLRLLLLFLEFLDFFQQVLHLLPVIGKFLQIVPGFQPFVRLGEPLYIEALRLLQGLCGPGKLLTSRIQLLAVQRFLSLLNGSPRRLMDAGPQVEETPGPDPRTFFAQLNGPAVQFCGPWISSGLCLSGVIVKLHRVRGPDLRHRHSGLRLFRQLLCRLFRSGSEVPRESEKNQDHAGLPLGNQKVQKKQNQRRREKIRKTLNRNAPDTRLADCRSQTFDPPVHGGNTAFRRTASHINPSGGQRQIPEFLLSEFGTHQFALTVPHGRPVRHGHQRRHLRVPQSEDEEGDVFGFQCRHRPGTVPGKFIAVCNENNGPEISLRRLKRFCRRIQRPFKIRPPQGHGVRVQFIHILEKTCEIPCQGTLQICRPRKCNESETVPPVGLSQIPDQITCMAQTRRRHIRGPHAL